MRIVGRFSDYDIGVLEKAVAEKYASQIAGILSLIPLVSYSEREVVRERADGVEFLGKWELSLIAQKGERIAGVIMGYERAAGPPEEYPQNTIYISELAVALDHQRLGLGRYLLSLFLERATARGFCHLNGQLLFSVQTNAADWNLHVQELYSSFGFTVSGRKTYPNRTDVIMMKR